MDAVVKRDGLSERQDKLATTSAAYVGFEAGAVGR